MIAYPSTSLSLLPLAGPSRRRPSRPRWGQTRGRPWTGRRRARRAAEGAPGGRAPGVGRGKGGGVVRGGARGRALVEREKFAGGKATLKNVFEKEWRRGPTHENALLFSSAPTPRPGRPVVPTHADARAKRSATPVDTAAAAGDCAGGGWHGALLLCLAPRPGGAVLPAVRGPLW